jgi:hypothetical protein
LGFGLKNKTVNVFRTILILVAAFLAVFGEATLPILHHWLGAQVDLLPVLMVYAALTADIATVSLLAVLGGSRNLSWAPRPAPSCRCCPFCFC